jgi:hypothetical protein
MILHDATSQTKRQRVPIFHFHRHCDRPRVLVDRFSTTCPCRSPQHAWAFACSPSTKFILLQNAGMLIVVILRSFTDVIYL